MFSFYHLVIKNDISATYLMKIKSAHLRIIGFAIHDVKLGVTPLRMSKWKRWVNSSFKLEVSLNSNLKCKNFVKDHWNPTHSDSPSAYWTCRLKLRAVRLMFLSSLLMRDLAQTLFLDPCFEISVENKPFHISLGNPPKSFVSWAPNICSTGSEYSHIHICWHTHTLIASGIRDRMRDFTRISELANVFNV